MHAGQKEGALLAALPLERSDGEVGGRWDAGTADQASLPESMEHSDRLPKEHPRGLAQAGEFSLDAGIIQNRWASSKAFSTQMLIKLAPAGTAPRL